MKKRLISLLLAFSMMLTFLPAGAVSAFAEGTADDTTKGTLLHDGDETITKGGTYRLSGTYTEGIEINTSDPVIINIADDDEVSFEPKEHAKLKVLLYIDTSSNLAVNNHGVYNGPTFLCTSGDSDNAKVTIHGGHYHIKRQPNLMPSAFAFAAGGSDANPIVVDGVHIEGGEDCSGIDAGAYGGWTAPKVKIKNSEINVRGTGYTAGGAINIIDSRTSVILEDVKACASLSPTIMIGGGNLTINSGRYTSDSSSVVSVYKDNADDVPKVTINGGKFIGSSSWYPTLWFGKSINGTMEIHGGTFTSTQNGQLLGSYGNVKIDGTVSVPEFNSEGGTADAIVNAGVGKMEFNDGIIKVSGGSGSDRAALRADGTDNVNITSKTEINGGKIIGANYGIQVWKGKPNVILSGDVQFENNGTDIYLNKNQVITIESSFKNAATIDCADPKDGRQLTKATETNYQKDLNLTSANAGYLVGYKKTADGEYRCFFKKVGVTISDLKGEIKAEESAEFTVTLTHEKSTGTGILTFGSKNGEIEYKDKTGAYHPMPKDGLEVKLAGEAGEAGDKSNYEFRITLKDAGAQTLTATVMRDDVKLGTADKDYTVAGRDHTTVTIEDLEDAVIKEGESRDFTVKVDPKDDAKLGEAVIDFGGKNSEIEYKDKNGEYQSMPKDGLPIDLRDAKDPYAFRITPKENGKQTLTAAVKKGENELARDEKDFVVAEMPILTLKDGVITSVTVPGKDGADPEDITEFVKKNANEDGSFNVPEGATVSVAFDKDAFADSGLKFGHWDITGLDDPNAYQNKESFDFKMPAKAVTLKAMTQDASIEDDEPDIVGPIVIGTTVVVGGAVLGYQAYSLGAEFAGKLMALPYFPSNRSALAMMLWEDAGKPMPESELLYPDVGQEEQDMDLQHAARWAMENELIPDLNDEGTAPEEMKFYPDNAVSKIDVLNAWQKAQELKQNA